MSKPDILCFRCGASLAALTLPLSRRDLCPQCSAHVHVCRQCRFFDAGVTGQCLEDDAEEVLEKDRVNYCEWFAPSATAYDGDAHAARERAASDLAALFGDGEAAAPEPSAADDLFK